MSQSFEIEFKKSVSKDVRKLPQAVLIFIKKRILELSENPWPIYSKGLKGYPGYYRIRVSSYRVVYYVDMKRKLVVIIRIRHRKDVYRV